MVFSNFPTYKQIPGRPDITVSPVGVADGYITNGGADFGPDTPGTTTSGIAEALNTGLPISLLDGQYNITDSIPLPLVSRIRGTANAVGVGQVTTPTLKGTIIQGAPGKDVFQITQATTIFDIEGVSISWASAETVGWGINTTASSPHMINSFFLDKVWVTNSTHSIQLINAMYGKMGYVVGSSGIINLTEEDANNNYGNLTIDTLICNYCNINGTTHSLGENLITINRIEVYPDSSTYGLYINNGGSIHINSFNQGGTTYLNAIQLVGCDDIGFNQVSFGANGASFDISNCKRIVVDAGLGYAPIFTVSPWGPGVITTRMIGGVNNQGFSMTTPAVPTSGTALQNTNPFSVRIYVLTASGVTYTITDPSGTTSPSITAAAGSEITLAPGASITPTYTTLTWKWYGE